MDLRGRSKMRLDTRFGFTCAANCPTFVRYCDSLVHYVSCRGIVFT